MRPGEKLYEELLHASEALVPTTHPGILLAAPRAVDPGLLGAAIDELAAAAHAGRTEETRLIVERLIPEYRSPERQISDTSSDHSPTAAGRTAKSAATG